MGRTVNKEQITIRLPTELKEIIQAEADKKGISINAMVIILLRKGLEV